MLAAIAEEEPYEIVERRSVHLLFAENYPWIGENSRNLMVFVIFMGVIDVGWTIYQKLMAEPVYILTISDMLATFGAFMAVLIAIEIFINITIYLRENAIHVKIVMATALMAIARKVIILDLSETNYMHVIAIVWWCWR